MKKVILPAEFGVVRQVKTAIHPRNRIATITGMVFGGFVPIATYTLAHNEATHNPLMWAMVAGGLLFSALTVYTWAKEALKHSHKALGFVLLTEGVLTFSHTPLLSLAALALLVAINGIATGCKLTVQR